MSAGSTDPPNSTLGSGSVDVSPSKVPEVDVPTVSSVAGSDVPRAPLALYSEVGRPGLPLDHTALIDPRWHQAGSAALSSGLGDGTYWATVVGDGTGLPAQVEFRLTEAYFGSACEAHFGGRDGSCDDGVGTDDTNSGEFVMVVGEAGVTVSDEMTQLSLQIDGGELFRLVAGGSAASAAPAGYRFVGFPFFVTVQDGHIVSVDQVWMP